MKTWSLLLSLLFALAPLHADHHGGKKESSPPVKKVPNAAAENRPNLVALKKRHAKLKRTVAQEHREWSRLDRELRRAMKDNPEAAAPYRKAIQILKKEHKRSHMMMDRVAQRIATLEAPKSCGMDGCVCEDCKKGTCACEKCKTGACKDGKCEAGEKKCCGENGCCKKPKEGKADHQAHGHDHEHGAGQDHGHGGPPHAHTLPIIPKENSELKSLEAEARELVKKAEELQKKVEALQKGQ